MGHADSSAVQSVGNASLSDRGRCTPPRTRPSCESELDPPEVPQKPAAAAAAADRVKRRPYVPPKVQLGAWTGLDREVQLMEDSDYIIRAHSAAGPAPVLLRGVPKVQQQDDCMSEEQSRSQSREQGHARSQEWDSSQPRQADIVVRREADRSSAEPGRCALAGADTG
ncbi:uncharacterized protein LOC119092809 [Pollicipes pollicipes]|uniref:uncharacterized protein LOC119092809 n=1 Tax=Pollicipes pollicipes TaxID=41117 RepID=UPI0018858A7A|nr:uncharacterized protein LOC119092809 [Pollicipes pollicipes]